MNGRSKPIDFDTKSTALSISRRFRGSTVCTVPPFLNRDVQRLCSRDVRGFCMKFDHQIELDT